MTQQVPRYALTFMAKSGQLAVKHGLKKGLSKAASKANPALLVIEAAASVAEAVNSFYKLSRAKEHRNGLEKLIPLEEDRLSAERDQLSEQLEMAKEEINLQKDVQRRLGELVLMCANACKTSWSELEAIRSSDLPDLEAFDEQFEKIESAWMDLRHALENYNNASA
jgi:aspartyl-tRNA synthetase